MGRSYQQSEVEEILTRAMALHAQRSETFSHQQILEMATELGIPAADLEAAMQDWEKDRPANTSSAPGKTESSDKAKPVGDPFWRKAAPPAVIVGGLLVMGPISLLATIPIAHHLNKRNKAQQHPQPSS
ncbi:hypothetical protein L1047_12770 [Synechococcus sp. Nb3U1]|uniref:hypothetical protein n=1 Tax=Synechococcus sp. Nb3U1 TaxID=1914529 RepID=UPI001F1D22DC|nr:hypothetical protein [Synechococcus sp. Nb3U1]MCF2972069.1 hypothetical protein [Synechococcus sp. Nb3U1]